MHYNTNHRNREQQKSKSLEYYHKIGKAQRRTRNEVARQHKAAVLEGLRKSDEDTPLLDNAVENSDPNQSGCSDSDPDDSSYGYDSDASVEGGLLSIDTTFLKQYQSENWLCDRDDTVDYRIRCLHEDLKLWLAQWGGVENWPDISADPARVMEIRGQMELGLQYAALIWQVWGAKVQGRVVESVQVELYWKKATKMMSQLYDALSLLGTHMHWDSE